jgi:hypothetical protein
LSLSLLLFLNPFLFSLLFQLFVAFLCFSSLLFSLLFLLFFAFLCFSSLLLFGFGDLCSFLGSLGSSFLFFFLFLFGGFFIPSLFFGSCEALLFLRLCCSR